MERQQFVVNCCELKIVHTKLQRYCSWKKCTRMHAERPYPWMRCNCTSQAQPSWTANGAGWKICSNSNEITLISRSHYYMRCRVHDILEIFFETTYYYSSDQSKHQVFPFPRCTVAHLQPNSQGFIQVLHLDCVCVGAGCALLLGSDRDELVRRIPRLLNGANSIRFDYPGPSGNTFSFCFGHDSSRTLQTCTERTAPIFFVCHSYSFRFLQLALVQRYIIIITWDGLFL